MPRPHAYLEHLFECFFVQLNGCNSFLDIAKDHVQVLVVRLPKEKKAEMVCQCHRSSIERVQRWDPIFLPTGWGWRASQHLQTNPSGHIHPTQDYQSTAGV